MFDNHYLKYGCIGLTIFAFVDLITSFMGFLAAYSVPEEHEVSWMLMLVPLLLSTVNMAGGLAGLGGVKDADKGWACRAWIPVLIAVYVINLVMHFVTSVDMGVPFMIMYPAALAVYAWGVDYAGKDRGNSRE